MAAMPRIICVMAALSAAQVFAWGAPQKAMPTHSHGLADAQQASRERALQEAQIADGLVAPPEPELQLVAAGAS